MVECAFATETNRGTLCRYSNCPCFSFTAWTCPNMGNAVEEFEELLNNVREMGWSIEFMEEVVKKYGGEDD